MPERVLRTPTLVSAPTGSASLPRIVATRCACGHLFHPPQAYGCERCGRDGKSLERIEFDARGTVTAIAAVFAHPKLPTPFTLGRITLDAGPSIEARLGDAAAALGIGARVGGRLEAAGTNDAGASVLECRFFAEGSG